MEISDEPNEGDIKKTNPLDKKEKPTIDYFRDKSLTSKKGDKFKHLHYVKVLKDILLKSETPLNVGLYGKWGVGKSSIVHMLKEELESEEFNKDFQYVEVDAWGLSGSSLQQGILEEINFQLGEKKYSQKELEDVLYNVQEVESLQISKIFKSYGRIWALIAVIAGGMIVYFNEAGPSIILSTIGISTIIVGISTIIAALIPLTKLFLSSSKKIIPKAVSSFQFNKIYKNIVNSTQKKLVVVIDNLDRCDDKIAVELLGIIQTFMVKHNCINILACDDEAIITHLKSVKGGTYTERDGNEFLSKFFQVTLRIPPFIGENLEKYTEELMENRSVKFNPFVRNILISGAIENPRKINQFLNNAVALFRLAEFKEIDNKLPKGIITDHTEFLTKIIVIRHEWPEFYKALEEYPDMLIKPKLLETWLTERISNPEYVRLGKFLNATQYAYVDDVTPFLRLNQESFASESGIDEFATAISTLDPKAKKLFQQIEPEKQNQYLKKIGDMMNKNSQIEDNLTLLNCALSLIGILELTEERPMREQILAILGKHLSENLLLNWNKFDIEKLNLFQILEEMLPVFSKIFYEKVLDGIFADDGLNENVFNLFMKYGNMISKNTMDKVDKKYIEMIDGTPIQNLERLVKICTENKWVDNNITKPSNMIMKLIKDIQFPLDNSDTAQRVIFEKIEDFIDSSEREIYLKNICNIIRQKNSVPEVLSEPMITSIQKILLKKSDENQKTLESMFQLLCENLEKNPDLIQSEKILGTIIEFEKHLSSLSNLTITPRTILEESISKYLLQKSTHKIILELLQKSKYNGFDISASSTIISALMQRFMGLGASNPEIIKILLKENSYETRKIIAENFNKLISSNEPAKYNVLLSTAEENDSAYHEDLIESIRKYCKSIADDEEFVDRFTFYQHVLKLKPSYYETNQIIDYAESLIESENVSEQDQGMQLARMMNSNSKRSKPIGVSKSLDVCTDFIQKNSKRVAPFLAFIYENIKELNYSQETQLIKLLNMGFHCTTSENIVNNIMSFGMQSPSKILVDIFDAMIDCAMNSPFKNAKEQCKQFLISQKEILSLEHKERLKESFGEGVLG